VFPDDGTTHEVLIAEADRRMYRDKANRKRIGSPAPSPSEVVNSPLTDSAHLLTTGDDALVAL
jgi:hypothetical protein